MINYIFILTIGESYVIVKREKLNEFPSKFDFRLHKANKQQSTDTNGIQHLFLMPPPNITGKLHLGHCLIFTIQDALHRYYNLKNQKSFYLAGLDHAGLATHQKILEYMESIGLSNDNYNKCAKELTETNSKTIINQINMLNIDCNTENHLYTRMKNIKI